MEFIPAGELLGPTATVRTLTLCGAPGLPDGAYSLVDCYCTDPACDCRKTMIQVHLDRRYVSLICFGWESPEYYATWYGQALDERTLAEMRGPSIDISSPDLVSPEAMLAFFIGICDGDYRQHLQSQYVHFKTALNEQTAPQILTASRRSGARGGNRRRNEPCPCGSGRKFKRCCGRGG